MKKKNEKREEENSHIQELNVRAPKTQMRTFQIQ
jgi:hypothetical protein